MKIIAYNDYKVYFSHSQSPHDFHENPAEHAKPSDICLFCNNKMIITKAFDPFANSKFDYIFQRYDNGIFLNECKQCGWWESLVNYIDMGDGGNERWNSTQFFSIVKSFDADDKFLPIDVLNNEVKKNPEIIYAINSKKFEEFVKSVLSDFFSCEVIHCGKTGDGGIDLIILNSDKPVLVQVKRRVNKNKTEPIKCIREFLGTMFINHAKHGIYVTTAKNISDGSIKIQKNLLDNNDVKLFEIYNFDKIVSIFNLTYKNRNPISLISETDRKKYNAFFNDIDWERHLV